MYLNIKTEFSFGSVFGHINEIVQKIKELGFKRAGICDLENSFGFVRWQDACTKAGIKPVFGVSLAVVSSIPNERRYPFNYMPLIALNSKGISELYELINIAYKQFYYRPLLTYNQINKATNNILVLSGIGPKLNQINRDFLLQLSPDLPFALRSIKSIKGIACIDNNFINANDVPIYEPFADQMKLERKTTPQHILTEKEWLQCYPKREDAILLLKKLGKNIESELPKAPLIKWEGETNLKKLCIEGAKNRKIDINKKEIKERLDYELKLINKKKFTDYFLVVNDVVQFAKTKMLVGHARGSAAGSLVCYLLGITEVNPLQYGLLFERFIDINRQDLPDIDIDFQDNKRYLITKYLSEKYGENNVAQIGNISRLKGRSAIGRFAKAICIPESELEPLKEAIPERQPGDLRYNKCIEDTFKTNEIGKQFAERYPNLIQAGRIEEHASHSSVHAAGVIISNKPITKYCAINSKENNIAMIDKKDAEKLNLLKIDVLGLRTLTIIAEICQLINKPLKWIYEIPLDDKKTYKLLNKNRFQGVFQFEGEAIRRLAKAIKIKSINDLSALNALCRPGPLKSGGAKDYIDRKKGKSEVVYLDENKAIKKHTKETYGTIVYQEQLMFICREYAGLSWPEVSEIRKAMAKSQGKEAIKKYQDKFIKGAIKTSKAEKETAKAIFEKLLEFGAYAFNKSHSVSYSILSYITAYLKAHYPLEFTVASLNHTISDESGLKLLRDMVENDGIKYIAFDKDLSIDKWQIFENEKGKKILCGSLTNLEGIAENKAKTIIKAREENKQLTPALQAAMEKGDTPYKYLYPAKQLYGNYYNNPPFKNVPFVSEIKEISIDKPGLYAFIGKLTRKEIKDANSVEAVAKRNGKFVDPPTNYLSFVLEDDTETILCFIWRNDFEKMGFDIADNGKENKDWYFVIGSCSADYRSISVRNILKITK